MKRNLFLLLVICLTIAMFGCNSESHENDHHIGEYVSGGDTALISSEWKEDLYDDNSGSVQDAPYDKLVTQSCDIYTFINNCTLNNLSGSGTLKDVSQFLGIECLRENVPGNIYSIHPVKQGGLLYIFYRSLDFYEENYEIANWFYVKKALSYSNFDSVQIGSSIQDVIRVDPAAQVYETRILQSVKQLGVGDDEAYDYFSSHYLNDGILKFTYQYQNGKLRITTKEYYEDYQWWSDPNASKICSDDLRIAPSDWIDSSALSYRSFWCDVPIKKRVDHSKSYSQILHQTINYEEFISSDFFKNYFSDTALLNVRKGTLGMLDYRYPIECIRELDENQSYVIYRLDDGGLLYLFFRGGYFTHRVCISSTRQKADFDGICIGSGFQEIVAIDSSANYWVSETASYHLLKDGILVFSYEDDGKVSEIFYSDDFIYPKRLTFVNEKGNFDWTVKCSYRIIEQDFYQ